MEKHKFPEELEYDAEIYEKEHKWKYGDDTEYDFTRPGHSLGFKC